jgi:hypothetical protein
MNSRQVEIELKGINDSLSRLARPVCQRDDHLFTAAVAAMQGMLAGEGAMATAFGLGRATTIKEVAVMAVKQANALIAELDKEVGDAG